MKTLALLLWLSFNTIALTAPDWKEILGPPQGKLPGPSAFALSWRTNLVSALVEARQQNRPLFVTFRCLPCKQCAAFDQAVLEGGPNLNPILTQFITVRLTDAAQIDLRLFPVEGYADLDLSWWGWFLSPAGQVYGIFGGRDHESDATRISKDALIASLRRVLAHHYDPRRPKWDIDGSSPNLTGTPKSPRELPGYEPWFRGAHPETRNQSCIHCHQVNDILRQPAVAARTFDKQRDFDVWPLPENVGLTLDRDHGLRVTNVTPGSVADRAGIKSGDFLGAAGGRRLFGQADFRGVLHRGPRSAGEIEVWWTRDSDVMPGKLAVTGEWRRTILDWRMSVSQGIVGAYPGFFPLAIKTPRREQFKISADQMAVEPYLGSKPKGAAYDAGVRQNYILTAVNGQSPNLAGRAFLVWFIKQFDRGDRVTLTLLESPGKSREVTYQLPLRGE